jgi:hypothetical protein
MAQWVRTPPSAKRVRFVFAVIAVLVVIFALESFGVWPEVFTAQRLRP